MNTKINTNSNKKRGKIKKKLNSLHYYLSFNAVFFEAESYHVLSYENSLENQFILLIKKSHETLVTSYKDDPLILKIDE